MDKPRIRLKGFPLLITVLFSLFVPAFVGVPSAESREFDCVECKWFERYGSCEPFTHYDCLCCQWFFEY